MSLPNIFCRDISGPYGGRSALVRCGNPWLYYNNPRNSIPLSSRGDYTRWSVIGDSGESLREYGYITHVKPLSKIYFTIKYFSCLLSVKSGIQQ